MLLVVTTEQVHTFFEVQPTYCEKEYISCSKKVKQQFDSVLQQHYWCPHEESGTLQRAGDTVIEMRQRQSFQYLPHKSSVGLVQHLCPQPF